MRSPRRTTARPPQAAPRLAVAELEAALIQHIGRERYDRWFLPHTRIQIEPGRVVVGVPNLHLQEWLAKRFGKEVSAAVGEAAGRPMPARFAIEPELFQAARAKQQAANAKVEARETAKSPELEYVEPPPRGLYEVPAAAPARRGER